MNKYAPRALKDAKQVTNQVIHSGARAVKKAVRKPSARNELVKKVMKEMNLPMAKASKYIKDHGLY